MVIKSMVIIDVTHVHCILVADYAMPCQYVFEFVAIT